MQAETQEKRKYKTHYLCQKCAYLMTALSPDACAHFIWFVRWK